MRDIKKLLKKQKKRKKNEIYISIKLLEFFFLHYCVSRNYIKKCAEYALLINVIRIIIENASAATSAVGYAIRRLINIDRKRLPGAL